MANWANYRLVVHGRRPAVLAFSRRYPVRASSAVWGPFYVGEMGQLRVDDIKDDEEEDRYWEASWELMDLAEAHWAKVVEKALA